MSTEPRLVQIVSKPVAPPWDDSGKNIVKELVDHAGRYAYRIMSVAGYTHPSPLVASEPLYGDPGSYSPGIGQNLRALGRAIRPGKAALLHFFFAPNPVSSWGGRTARLLSGRWTVQTVSSAPRSWKGVGSLLFADRIIVLSEHSKRRLLAEGVKESRVRMVRPGITPVDVSEERRILAQRKIGVQEAQPTILYPGDLEFSSAAETIAASLPEIGRALPKVKMIFACRPKTPAARVKEELLKERLAASGCLERTVLLGKVDDMPALLAAASLVVLPADDLYAKMDIPLVILEAMSLGVPVLVADAAPLNEAVADEAGAAVPAHDSSALASAVIQLLSNPDRLRKTGEKGRTVFQERFLAGRMAAEVELVYDELTEAIGR